LSGNRTRFDAVQPPAIGYTLELVLAAIDEAETGTRDEILDGSRDENLVCSGKSTDAGAEPVRRWRAKVLHSIKPLVRSG
jgi:hypothetical protein